MLRLEVEKTEEVKRDAELLELRLVTHPQLPKTLVLDRMAAADLAARLLQWLHSHQKPT